MAEKAMLLPSLSAFFPCYNEEKNLPLMVTALEAVLPRVSKLYEIIVVDDGSRDGTGPLADKLAARSSHIRVVHHPKNRGYGASLRSGFAAARYEWTFFTDGDKQFDVGELTRFIPFTPQYDVVIGYRASRADGIFRSFNAFLYKLFIDILFRVHVKDIDCAFKLIRTRTVQSLPFLSNGATINAELLYRLKKRRYAFKQLPVSHYPRRYGKPTGNNPKVVVKAGLESMSLYLHLKFGRTRS